jgi:hypothetical protein
MSGMRRRIPSASGAAFKKPEPAAASARPGGYKAQPTLERRNFRLAAGFCSVTHRNWMEDAAAPVFRFRRPQIVPEDKCATAEHRGECRIVRRQRARPALGS